MPEGYSDTHPDGANHTWRVLDNNLVLVGVKKGIKTPSFLTVYSLLFDGDATDHLLTNS